MEVQTSSPPQSAPSSRPVSPRMKPKSPVKNMWEKAYSIQREELPIFPSDNQKEFSPYLKKLGDILEQKKSRHASYEVASRMAILNHADARNDDAIPYFETAMEGLRPMASKDPGSKLLFQTTGLRYANALDLLGEYDKAEAVFEELVECNANGEHIIEYAIFLQRRKKDMLRAQMYFERAVEVFPKHASVCLKYATFMRHVRRDTKIAEIYYKKCTELNPNFSEGLGSYASFLYGLRRNLSLVPALYQQAVDLDPYNTSNLCNYGLFLSEEKSDYTKAESVYQQALAINASHSNTLYNYGVMLDTHLNRKQEAETFYRRAIVAAPGHAYALYNLAVLLEEEERKKGNIKSIITDVDIEAASKNAVLIEIKNLYAKASEADQKDPDISSDYGRFLLMRMGEIDAAEIHLTKALSIASSNEVALFHMGTLLYKNIIDLISAYQHLDALVTVNPRHLPGRQQLARVLADLQRELIAPKSEPTPQFQSLKASLRPKDFMEVAATHYEESIKLAGEPDRIILEYIRAVNKSGTPSALMRCIGFVDTILSGPSKYPDLNLLLDQVRTKLSSKKK